MFGFDIFNRPEPSILYLCRPDGSIVCELNGIDEQTASLTLNMNNQHTMTFDYLRYINLPDGRLVESNGYFSLCVGMKILISGIGYFVMKYPPMEDDGTVEKKSVTINSVDCELENKDLVSFKINTGESDSLEYLVTYDDDEAESLLNAYTGLPYDYIVFDNTYPAQLAELLNKYEDGSTITDSSSIEEIKSYCSLTPRLKSKVITETVTDDDGNESEEMSLVEYVEYTYDDAGENVVSIYLFDGFNDRISYLIEFYEKYHDQLSLISLAIENCSCNWSIGEIDQSLVNKKYQFDVDGENIYSFLTNDVASTIECVFSFDLFNKKINVILAENIGEDSGVIIDKENLMNSLTVSCSEDSIYTRYNVSGGNDIDIAYVNFGSTRIVDISYFLNARDENGNRIYVSDELAEKYFQYEKDREIARESYIAYTKEYNQLLIDIDELKYRVPNDSVQNDWDTYTLAELEAALTTYNQLLVTLISLYKEDYGSVGCNSDGSVNESYIRTTEYWWDYYAYQQTITQIQYAYEARANDSTYADIDSETALALINAYKTEWSLYGTVELQSKITSYNNSLQVLIDAGSVYVMNEDTYDYLGTCSTEDGERMIEITLSGEYPSTLDGIVIAVTFEHEHTDTSGVYFSVSWEWDSGTGFDVQKMTMYLSQKYTWDAGDTILFRYSASDTKWTYLAKYQEGAALPWTALTSAQQESFGYLSGSYYYDDYMEIYNNKVSCQEYLDQLLLQLEELESEQQTVQASRSAIVALVTVEGYNRSELAALVDLEESPIDDTFAEDEIKTINLMIIDKNYSNENILTTSLDDTVSEVDVQYELLQDAIEELSKESQPQITFSVELDNLLAMPEFKDFKFEIGNYVTVRYYDEYYVTLRLYTMTFNPCIPEDSLEVTFTNYIKSNSERSDLSYILSQSSGSSSSSSSSNGSSSSSFGTSDDIDVTISNTMLAKLLNTEMFGSRVSNVVLDTINVNALSATYATFGGLANGTTTIDGKCITTGYIIDTDYNGTDGDIDNTKGSIINLETGKISLGGGALTWDSSDFSVTGNIYADNGYIGGSDGFTITTKHFYSGSKSSMTDTNSGVYIGTDGIALGADSVFKVTDSGALTATSATITGTITANDGYIGGTNGFYIQSEKMYSKKSSLDSASSGVYIGTDGIALGANSVFYVTDSGELHAKSAYIDGTISAGSGSTIGGFTVGSSALYSDGHSAYNTAVSGVYIGTDYISLGSGGISYFYKDGTGKIGSFTIGGSYLRNGAITSATNTSVSGVYVGTDGFNVSGGTAATTAYFTKSAVNIGNKLTWNGTTLNVTGAVTATSLTFYDTMNLYSTFDSTSRTAMSLYNHEALSIGEGFEVTFVESPLGVYGDTNIYNADLGVGGTVYSSKASAFQLTYGDYGVILRNDGSDFWILLTDSGDSNGSFNSLRPFRIVESSGVVVIDNLQADVATNDGSYRTPIGSAAPNGNRVGFIGCNTSAVNVHGQAGVEDGSYVTMGLSYSSSDIRLKDNISDCEVSALPLIRQIPMHSFDWNNRTENSHQKIGMVADEIEILDPMLAQGGGYDEDGSMNIKIVDTFYLLGYTVKAIQEIDDEAESLRAELTEAYNKIEELEKEVYSLQSSEALWDNELYNKIEQLEERVNELETSAVS